MFVHELRAKRATVYDEFKALAENPDFKILVDQPKFEKFQGEIKELDASIERLKASQELSAKTALPVAGQEERRVPVAVKDDP